MINSSPYGWPRVLPLLRGLRCAAFPAIAPDEQHARRPRAALATQAGFRALAGVGRRAAAVFAVLAESRAGSGGVAARRADGLAD